MDRYWLASGYILNHHICVNLCYMLNSLLSYVEVGFLKRYLILLYITDRHTHKCSSSLGPSWELNQGQLGWQVGARARLTDG